MADKKNINSTIHYISNPKHKGRGFQIIRGYFFSWSQFINQFESVYSNNSYSIFLFLIKISIMRKPLPLCFGFEI